MKKLLEDFWWFWWCKGFCQHSMSCWSTGHRILSGEQINVLLWVGVPQVTTVKWFLQCSRSMKNSFYHISIHNESGFENFCFSSWDEDHTEWMFIYVCYVEDVYITYLALTSYIISSLSWLSVCVVTEGSKTYRVAVYVSVFVCLGISTDQPSFSHPAVVSTMCPHKSEIFFYRVLFFPDPIHYNLVSVLRNHKVWYLPYFNYYYPPVRFVSV
jgi:hypothetical protein